jgi:hypothetical protein
MSPRQDEDLFLRVPHLFLLMHQGDPEKKGGAWAVHHGERRKKGVACAEKGGAWLEKGGARQQKGGA